MKKIIQAKGNVIIVKQKKESVSKGGIVIAKQALEGGSMEEFEGTILATGPAVTKFKKGEIVSFGRNSFSIKKWASEEFLLLFEYAINTAEKIVDDNYIPTESEFVVQELKNG